MRIHELGHIVLYVQNLEQSTHFYETVLGWKRIPVPQGMPAAAFSSGRTHHELLLIEVGSMAQPLQKGMRLGLYHFGLKVGDTDDELRQVYQELLKHNITLLGSADHTVSHSLYIEDPDGNEIELYVDVPGVDWKKDPHLFASRPKPLEL